MTQSREPIHAPRGTQLSCKSWATEGAMRMLMNNLDPEVAEHPDQLIVYGGSGRAARSWDAYAAIIRTLQGLNEDETLLVQSGKPVGVLRTHEWAPRVLIANSNLVPQWATWEEFRRLEQLGLTMYGQMTAGSWIYIGTQGILQGTYETFAACARKHFDGTLRGRLVLSAGLGGMGGAQPLAVTMNEGVGLFVEIDRERIDRRLRLRYVDRATESLDEALRWAEEAKRQGIALSIALYGNACEVHEEIARRGIRPDVVTDQTSAHDMLNGYVPAGLSPHDAGALCVRDPKSYLALAGSLTDVTRQRVLIEVTLLDADGHPIRPLTPKEAKRLRRAPGLNSGWCRLRRVRRSCGRRRRHPWPCRPCHGPCRRRRCPR